MPYIDALSELDDPGDGTKPWCDLVFDLTELATRVVPGSAKDTRLITGRGMATAQGSDIGFGFEIPILGWTEQKLDQTDLSIHFGNISLLSAGEPTDRLIVFYEDWFGVPHAGVHARARNDCKAVLLGGSIALSKPFVAKTKLFFDFNDKDEDYAELFFNLDTGAKRLRLMEKDPDYRAALLRWLRSAP